VVFGCWTSVSRKAVLSVFEEYDHLLLYPVQNEGEECSTSIFYTGAVPNQQATPAVQYLYDYKNITQFILVGTDYVYPRTTNSILSSYLIDTLNIPPANIITIYTPFSHSDWVELVKGMIAFYKDGLLAGKNTAIISTINGDANTYFYSEISNQYSQEGITSQTLPIVAFSVGEAELSVLPKSDLVKLNGHYAAWNYFMSINNTLNNNIKSEFFFISDNK